MPANRIPGLRVRRLRRPLHAFLASVLALCMVLPVLGRSGSASAACPKPKSAVWDPLYDTKGKSIDMGYRVIQQGGQRILEARGTIRPGETSRLRQALDRNRPIHEIWLYSGGGTSVEGMNMGRLIRQRGLAIRVPTGAVCFSACSMVFLGGALRAVDPGAHYGVHMWTAWSDESASRLLSEMLKQIQAKVPGETIIRDMRNKMRDEEQRNADYARKRANYLIEMSVSLRLMIPNVQTEASNQYWLCPNELRSFNVTNY